MHSSTSTLTITVNSTLYFLNLAFSARGQIIFQINKHTLQGIWHKREYLRHINLDTIWYVCRQGYVLPCKIYFLHLAIHSSARTISRCFFPNLIIRQANSSKSSLLLITHNATHSPFHVCTSLNFNFPKPGISMLGHIYN